MTFHPHAQCIGVVGEACVWVRTGKKVARNWCVFRWKYSKPTACSADLLRIWEGNGCHHSNWNFSVWCACQKLVLFLQSNTVSYFKTLLISEFEVPITCKVHLLEFDRVLISMLFFILNNWIHMFLGWKEDWVICYILFSDPSDSKQVKILLIKQMFSLK